MVQTRLCRRGLVFLSILAVARLPAQNPRLATLVVTVFADSGIVALNGAEVSIVGLDRAGRTDSLGELTLHEIPFGTHTIRVRTLGYSPVEAPLSFRTEMMTAEFHLLPMSAKLDTVRVSTGRLPRGPDEFEQRRAFGLGRFLTQRQLDSASTVDFQTLATVRFPGLTTVRLGTGDRVLASTRGSCGADASRVGSGRAAKGSSCASGVPCVVPTFLNGEEVRGADAEVKPRDLAGVEYYTASQVPAQYRVSGTACGVLLLWSRR